MTQSQNHPEGEMDSTPRPQGIVRQKTLSNLTPLVPVNIDFTDLNYTVHQNEYGELLIRSCGLHQHHG
jgi:hypothetical protein